MENQRNRGKRLFLVKFFTEKLIQRRRRLRISQRPVRLMGNIEMAAEFPQIPARKLRKVFPGELQGIDTAGFKGKPGVYRRLFQKGKIKEQAVAHQHILSQKIQKLWKDLPDLRRVIHLFLADPRDLPGALRQLPAGIHQALPGLFHLSFPHPHRADFYDFICFGMQARGFQVHTDVIPHRTVHGFFPSAFFFFSYQGHTSVRKHSSHLGFCALHSCLPSVMICML